MKSTLSFVLPDEQYDWESAINGSKYRSILWDVDQYCREKIKYTESLTDEQISILDELRDLIRDSMREESCLP